MGNVDYFLYMKWVVMYSKCMFIHVQDLYLTIMDDMQMLKHNAYLKLYIINNL